MVVAGQSHDNATGFAADLLALRAHRDGHRPAAAGRPDWVGRIERLEPAEVVFAHDHSSWRPG